MSFATVHIPSFLWITGIPSTLKSVFSFCSTSPCGKNMQEEGRDEARIMALAMLIFL